MVTVRDFTLESGRVLHATIEVEYWSVWLDDDERTHVIGAPLEGVLMEVLGLNPARDEITDDVHKLASRIRSSFPTDFWPKEPGQ